MYVEYATDMKNSSGEGQYFSVHPPPCGKPSMTTTADQQGAGLLTMFSRDAKATVGGSNGTSKLVFPTATEEESDKKKNTEQESKLVNAEQDALMLP